MANLVWGVENTVPSQAGKGVSGKEMALRTEVETTFAATAGVNIRYVMGTTVPENWIPFVPIRLQADGQMSLRRAALPRTIGSGPPVRIRPRTQLLRDGLDTAQTQAYDLNEEEITMPGIVVRQCWRQARWFDGKIFSWLGQEKMYARPARASGLRFDTAEAAAKT